MELLLSFGCSALIVFVLFPFVNLLFQCLGCVLDEFINYCIKKLNRGEN